MDEIIPKREIIRKKMSAKDSDLHSKRRINWEKREEWSQKEKKRGKKRRKRRRILEKDVKSA